MQVHVKETAATNPKYDVLLLHGAAFTSKTWAELFSEQHSHLNVLNMIAAAGHRAVAIDLPGDIH